LRRHDFIQREAREPLDDQPQAASGSLNILWMCVAVPTDRGRPARLLDRGVALGEDRDQLAVGDRVVDQADRALARDGEAA